MKTIILCAKCAALMGYEKKVAGGVDNKVQCSHCGRRLFGGEYETDKKGEKKK